jgi:hypothetical protein
MKSMKGLSVNKMLGSIRKRTGTCYVLSLVSLDPSSHSTRWAPRRRCAALCVFLSTLRDLPELPKAND